MTGPTVLTVILNWRTPEMTLRSAEAALRAMEGIAGALTIVDNASGDGSFETMTAEVARRGWDRVRVLQAGRNGGFGAGNNFGIRAGLPGGGRPDYVYVLNSDAFPAPDALQRLLDHLSAQPEAGFAGSYIHGQDGHPHETAFRFPSIAGEFEGAIRLGLVSRWLHGAIVPLPVPDRTTRVDWLAGASVLMRMDMLDRIGLFDEVFFLYYEETELMHRAVAAGFATDYVRDSEVEHIGSASTGMKNWARIPRFWLDSRLYYFTKVHGAPYAAMATLARLTGGALWRLRCFIQRRDPVDPPHFLADMALHYATHAATARREQPRGTTPPALARAGHRSMT